METIEINGEIYTKVSKKSKLHVIRTYSAGVVVGEIIERKDKEALVKDARIIHRWKGANTVIEIANNGIDRTYSRISEKADEMILTEVIMIVPVSEGVNLEPIWND